MGEWDQNNYVVLTVCLLVVYLLLTILFSASLPEVMLSQRQTRSASFKKFYLLFSKNKLFFFYLCLTWRSISFVCVFSKFVGNLINKINFVIFILFKLIENYEFIYFIFLDLFKYLIFFRLFLYFCVHEIRF